MFTSLLEGKLMSNRDKDINMAVNLLVRQARDIDLAYDRNLRALDDDLPDTWDDFKAKVIGLDDIQKQLISLIEDNE